jgi:hypothetical protein
MESSAVQAYGGAGRDWKLRKYTPLGLTPDSRPATLSDNSLTPAQPALLEGPRRSDSNLALLLPAKPCALRIKESLPAPAAVHALSSKRIKGLRGDVFDTCRLIDVASLNTMSLAHCETEANALRLSLSSC